MVIAQHFFLRRQAFLVQRLGGVVLALILVETSQGGLQPQHLHLVGLLSQRRCRHRDDPPPQLLKDHDDDAGKAHRLSHRIKDAVAVFRLLALALLGVDGRQHFVHCIDPIRRHVGFILEMVQQRINHVQKKIFPRMGSKDGG